MSANHHFLAQLGDQTDWIVIDTRDHRPVGQPFADPAAARLAAQSRNAAAVIAIVPATPHPGA